MSQYDILMNSLAKEIPHREDLLEGVNQLIEKYKDAMTPVIHITKYIPNFDDSAQANINAFSYENNSLEDKNDRLKQVVRDMAELL